MKIYLLVATMFLTGAFAIAQQNVGLGVPSSAYPLTVGAVVNKGIVQKDGAVELGFYTSVASAYLQTWSNHAMYFRANGLGPVQMVLSTTGNLGIGTLSPGQDVDVDGTIRMRGGNPALNRILTATDANGNTEWKPVVTGGVKTMFVPYSAFIGSSAYMGHVGFNNEARRASGFLANEYRYQAPLLLPVGTVIKEITWHYFDNNVEMNLEFKLVRDYFEDPSSVSETNSSGALNVDWSRNVIINHTLGSYFYWLEIGTFSWSSDESLRFKGALIKYE